MDKSKSISPPKDKLLVIFAILFLVITVLLGMIEIGMGAYMGYINEQTHGAILETKKKYNIIDYICGSMLCCCFTTPIGMMISITCFGIGKSAKKVRLIEEGRYEVNEFNNVWYLSRENTIAPFKIMAYEDVGRLVIQDNEIVYLGRKCNVNIRNITTVKYGKQGRDFMNNWVQIEHGENQKAFFADGNLLGWKGFFGGTKILFAAIYKRLNLK